MGHEKIPIPTEAEKQQAIARILDAGLPRRTALDRELWEVLQCVGPAHCCSAWGTAWLCPC